MRHILAAVLLLLACTPPERGQAQRAEAWFRAQASSADRSIVPDAVCGLLSLRGVATNCRAADKVARGAVTQAIFDLIDVPGKTGGISATVTMDGFNDLLGQMKDAPKKVFSKAAMVIVQQNAGSSPADDTIISAVVSGLAPAPADLTTVLSAREACKLLLFALRVNGRCLPAERAGISSWARERSDVRLVNGAMLGQVLTFDEDADFLKTIEKASDGAIFLGPHRYHSARSRVFVLLDDAAPAEVGDRVKAAVASL